MAVSGTRAYVANFNSNNLQIFNVATSNAPVLLGSVTTDGRPNSVAVSGTRAYVVNRDSNTLQVFEVATSGNTALLGTVATGSLPNSVAVSGPTAYVVNSVSNTLQTFDFPAAPRVVAVNPDGSFGSVALPSAADFIQNGTAPQVTASFNISGAGTVGGLLTAGNASIGGNAGIGLLSAPQATLELARGTGSDGTLAIRGTTRRSYFNFGTAEDTYLRGGKATSNVLLNDNGGSVGIGTPTPGEKLEVAGGNVFLSGENIGVIVDATGNKRVGLMKYAGREAGLWRTAGQDFEIGRTNRTSLTDVSAGTTYTPDLTVDGSGNVGIGTTPGARLHIAGNVKINGINTLEFGVGLAGKEINAGKIGYGAFSTDALDIIGAGNGSNNRIIRFYAEGGAVFNGPVYASAFLNSSDRRFKQNIRPLGGALASVLALRGVRYEWNALGIQRGGKAGAEQVGFIAQELEKLYPELVFTDAQGYKAVNYAQLTPVLIEALKEQQAQIEALKQEAAKAKAEASSAKAQTTATTDAFEARLRRLEAAGAQAAQARR